MIDNNYINYANEELDDGGGIYTYQGSYGDEGSAGSVIRNNIILNTFGNSKDGIVSAYGFGFGIYLDKNSHDITIENNTVGYSSGP